MIPLHSNRAHAAAAPSGWPRWRRIVPLAVITAAALVIFAMGWRSYLSFETLVRHRAALEEFVDSHFVAALAAYVAIYVGLVALSIPCSVFLTITGGILFGWLTAVATVLVSATAGATVIFLIAKTAFGEYFVRRAGPRLSRIVAGFRADAFCYLLFLRVVPLFPFALVNLAPALVGVPLRTFVAATALGIIPATFVFAAMGDGLDSVIRVQESIYRACVDAGRPDCRLDFDLAAAATPQLVGALIALGLLALVPVAIKRVYARKSGAGPVG